MAGALRRCGIAAAIVVPGAHAAVLFRPACNDPPSRSSSLLENSHARRNEYGSRSRSPDRKQQPNTEAERANTQAERVLDECLKWESKRFSGRVTTELLNTVDGLQYYLNAGQNEITIEDEHLRSQLIQKFINVQGTLVKQSTMLYQYAEQKQRVAEIVGQLKRDERHFLKRERARVEEEWKKEQQERKRVQDAFEREEQKARRERRRLQRQEEEARRVEAVRLAEAEALRVEAARRAEAEALRVEAAIRAEEEALRVEAARQAEAAEAEARRAEAARQLEEWIAAERAAREDRQRNRKQMAYQSTGVRLGSPNEAGATILQWWSDFQPHGDGQEPGLPLELQGACLPDDVKRPVGGWTPAALKRETPSPGGNGTRVSLSLAERHMLLLLGAYKTPIGQGDANEAIGLAEDSFKEHCLQLESHIGVQFAQKVWHWVTIQNGAVALGQQWAIVTRNN